jgi:hypothetical protein
MTLKTETESQVIQAFLNNKLSNDIMLSTLLKIKHLFTEKSLVKFPAQTKYLFSNSTRETKYLCLLIMYS